MSKRSAISDELENELFNYFGFVFRYVRDQLMGRIEELASFVGNDPNMSLAGNDRRDILRECRRLEEGIVWHLQNSFDVDKYISAYKDGFGGYKEYDIAGWNVPRAVVFSHCYGYLLGFKSFVDTFDVIIEFFKDVADTRNIEQFELTRAMVVSYFYRVQNLFFRYCQVYDLATITPPEREPERPDPVLTPDPTLPARIIRRRRDFDN